MRLSILFLTCALLAACGQKGPLRLPDEPAPKPPVMQPAPASTPAK